MSRKGLSSLQEKIYQENLLDNQSNSAEISKLLVENNHLKKKSEKLKRYVYSLYKEKKKYKKRVADLERQLRRRDNTVMNTDATVGKLRLFANQMVSVCNTYFQDSLANNQLLPDQPRKIEIGGQNVSPIQLIRSSPIENPRLKTALLRSEEIYASSKPTTSHSIQQQDNKYTNPLPQQKYPQTNKDQSDWISQLVQQQNQPPVTISHSYHHSSPPKLQQQQQQQPTQSEDTYFSKGSKRFHQPPLNKSRSKHKQRQKLQKQRQENLKPIVVQSRYQNESVSDSDDIETKSFGSYLDDSGLRKSLRLNRKANDESISFSDFNSSQLSALDNSSTSLQNESPESSRKKRPKTTSSRHETDVGTAHASKKIRRANRNPHRPNAQTSAKTASLLKKIRQDEADDFF